MCIHHSTVQRSSFLTSPSSVDFRWFLLPTTRTGAGSEFRVLGLKGYVLGGFGCRVQGSGFSVRVGLQGFLKGPVPICRLRLKELGF